jgi:hypothetical protein
MSASAHPTRKPASAKAQARIGVLKAAKNPPVELTWEQQKVADQWYWKFCQRWGNDLPQWRANILKGVARRLAVKPVPVGFGRSLFNHRGANTLARRCRAQGVQHPRIVAMWRGREWKQAGRPKLPACQLPVLA